MRQVAKGGCWAAAQAGLILETVVVEAQPRMAMVHLAAQAS